MKQSFIAGGGGMSLLELMVVTSLIGIVGLSFAFLYVTSHRFLIQSVNFTGSQGEASYGLEHIKRHLLQTTAIANPAADKALSLANGTFQFTWQRRVPPLPALGGVLKTLNSAYRLSGANLFFDEDQNAPSLNPIARGILGVTFTRTGANIVAVEILSRQTSGGDTRDTRLQTVVSPRGML